MSPAELFRRVAALLVATGLLAISVASISADQGDEEATVAVASQPTQLIAEIPDGYEMLFSLEWSGGSLHQLIGTLAGRGCALDTLWVHDLDEWNPYSRYGVPLDFALNQQFIQHYEQDVPAGTLYATCADQPIAQDLHPTQIVADIPGEFDTMFELHWGGGSLFQLKGRLATMGCIANNISVTDPDTNREYVYSQYSTRNPIPNEQFLKRYEQLVPAGSLSADCYEVCNFFNTSHCISFKERRHHYSSGAFSSLQHSTCTDNFLPQVEEVVFPLLPMHPDVCVVRDFNQNTGTIGGYVFTIGVSQPFIFVQGSNPTNDEYLTYNALHTEIHELCHINQHWHWIQQISHSSYHIYRPTQYFNNSEHGKEFIDLIGFTLVIGSSSTLPDDSVYRNIYSKEPLELAAELCNMYLIEKMGLESIYEYRIYNYPNRNTSNDYIRVPRRKIDVDIYLTPEIREWLETYMILPDVSE